MKFITKTLIISKWFGSMEEADQWLDKMVEEYDEYEDVGCTIKGGDGGYTAEINLFYQETELNGTGIIPEGSREPDLFDAG